MALLQKGSHGDAVRVVQRKLRFLGYGLGTTGVDGIYGPNTVLAVRRFQADCGLTVTGTVGRRTSRALALCYKAEGLVGHCRYVLGAETDLDNPYPTRLDCSEFVQWSVHQASGMTVVDGAAAQWAATSSTSTAPVSGDLVFMRGTYKPGISHVGIITRKKMVAGKPVWQVVHAANRFRGVVRDPLSHFTGSSHYAGRHYIAGFIRSVKEA